MLKALLLAAAPLIIYEKPIEIVEIKTGQDLLDVCRRKGVGPIIQCNFFVRDILRETHNPPLCLPKKKSDAYKAVDEGLKASGDLLKTDAYQLVVTILRRAYPCS